MSDFAKDANVPTNDYISRQAAIDAIERNAYRHTYIDQIVDIINELPSAQPERKRGEWIPVTNGRGGFECSKCHDYAPSYQNGDDYLSHYCPNCGAQMIGDKENDERI